MVAYNMEIKNTDPILRNLLTVIDNFNIEEHVYVSRYPKNNQHWPHQGHR